MLSALFEAALLGLALFLFVCAVLVVQAAWEILVAWYLYFRNHRFLDTFRIK